MLNLQTMYRVIEVQNRKQLRKFIEFPDVLYSKCPQYVPALHSDQVRSLTRTAPLKYCRRRMWMVLDGKKVVGRICAMINPRYNDLYKVRRVRFGWFDTINDLEVARLLIGTAQDWALSMGMTEIHGPLYYNTLGKQGMLVEGYENVPPFNCLYNYPYYNDLLESLGFEKECDWVQYKMVANHGVPDKTRRVASIISRKYNLHIGSIEELKRDPENVRHFFDIYNDSFSSSVYNFIPLTDEEIEEEASSVLKYITDKTSCVVLDDKEELVAFGIAFPSISAALQKAHGHLFPFGWIHLLRALHDYENTDLMLNGAVSEWQNTGVSALYYRELADRAIKIGNRFAVSNPQIESNSAVNIWNDYEHEPYMRRRCYIKKIN